MTGRNINALLIEAQHTMHWSQRTLGEHIGVSKRTISRWLVGGSTIGTGQILALVGHVHPRNPALAAQLAARAGQTLEGMGLAPGPATREASSLPRTISMSDLIDCVVCAVAEAGDLSPRVARPMALLALKRAHELGLDLGSVAQWVAETTSSPTAPTTGTPG